MLFIHYAAYFFYIWIKILQNKPNFTPFILFDLNVSINKQDYIVLRLAEMYLTRASSGYYSIRLTNKLNGQELFYYDNTGFGKGY